jgi:hypothetical protein
VKATTITIVIGLICFWNISAQAQSKTQFAIEGQIAATTNGKGLFLNIGGPALKFIFSKFGISINMVPSIRIQEEEPKSIVTPLLGVGIQLFFLKNKRFIICLPGYYYSSKNTWTLTAGIGYTITKPK